MDSDPKNTIAAIMLKSVLVTEKMYWTQKTQSAIGDPKAFYERAHAFFDYLKDNVGGFIAYPPSARIEPHQEYISIRVLAKWVEAQRTEARKLDDEEAWDGAFPEIDNLSDFLQKEMVVPK